MRTRTQLADIWPPTIEAAREAGHKDLLPLEAIRTNVWTARASNRAKFAGAKP